MSLINLSGKFKFKAMIWTHWQPPYRRRCWASVFKGVLGLLIRCLWFKPTMSWIWVVSHYPYSRAPWYMLISVDGLFLICQNSKPTLANLLHHLANFICIKRPNIVTLLNHLVTLVLLHPCLSVSPYERTLKARPTWSSGTQGQRAFRRSLPFPWPFAYFRCCRCSC